MIDNPEDLKNKAIDNKPNLRKEYVNIVIGDEEYGFRLAGIGAKAVKIEAYVKYDDIFEALENGNDNGLEAKIFKIIDEFEPPADEEEE